MKETKVYIDELPKSCSECVCVDDCYCGITQKNIYYEFYEWTKPNDCPLIDIKTHDRELVKEVCEKIRNKIDHVSMHTVTKERLMLMCEEIKKELEGEDE